MTKSAKILAQALNARSDANVRFDDLRGLLARLGFQERTRGSHRAFVKEGIRELINL